MANSTLYKQAVDNLEFLKLNEMTEHLDETIEYVNSNHLSFIEGIIKLTNYQRDKKQKNLEQSMVKTAGFPHLKEVKDFDFSFQPSINEEQIRNFLTMRFVDKHENIVFIGPSGVGKTHLSISIGIAAAKNRYTTHFVKCSALMEQLRRARLENRLEAKLKTLARYKVLIIDEIGYLPINKEDAQMFFQLIDRRYENKSTLFTTNISFNNWDEVFKDPILANAILDRILHHAHVVQINGKSYRMKDYYDDDE